MDRLNICTWAGLRNAITRSSRKISYLFVVFSVLFSQSGCSLNLSLLSSLNNDKPIITVGSSNDYIGIDNSSSFQIEGTCPLSSQKVFLISPVEKEFICLDGKFAGEIEIPSSTPEGPVSFELIPEDGKKVEWVVTKDITRPSVVISSPSAYDTNADISVQVTFSEPVFGFTKELLVAINAVDGEIREFKGAGANYSFLVKPLAQGLVNITLPENTVKDAAGNMNTAAIDLVRNYDSIAPIITGLSNDSTPKKSKTWNWDCDEDCTYRFLVDQAPLSLPLGSFDSTSSVSQISGDGTYYLHIQAQDKAGNLSDVKHISAVLDNTAPLIKITSTGSLVGNSSSVFKWDVDYSDGTISLLSSNILLNGTGTINTSSCQVTVVTKSSLKREIQITGCTGTGELKFNIEAGTAQDTALNSSSEAGPSSLVNVDENYIKPTISLSSPSPTVGKYKDTFEWVVTYTSVDNINLKVSDIELGGNATGCLVEILSDTSLSKKIHVTKCSDDGRLYLGIKAGTGTNSYGSTEAIAYNYGAGMNVELLNRPDIFLLNSGTYAWKTTDTPVFRWFTHPDKGDEISRYEIALGKSTSDLNIISWKSVGLETKFYANDLSLSYADGKNDQNYRTYSFCVRAVDALGKVSYQSCSEWAPTWGALKLPAYPSNGEIFDSVVDSNGRRTIVGSFTQVATQDTLLKDHVVLNSNGSFDLSRSFDSKADGEINEQGFFPDGKILLRGNFSYYDNVLTRGLAKVNLDGSIDATFQVGGRFSNIVSATPLSSGKVLVAGEIRENNSIKSGLWRVNPNGSLDSTFSPLNLSFSATSNYSTPPEKVILQSSGKFVVIGRNVKFCNGQSRNYICRFNPDGSFDGTFVNSNFDNTINDIAIQSDDKLVVIGGFNLVNGTSKKGIARLNPDGSLDSSFQSGTGFSYSYNGLISLQSDGSMVVSGVSSPYNGKSFGSSQIKIDQEGVFQNAISFATPLTSQPIAYVNGKIIGIRSYNDSQVTQLNLDGSLDATFQLDRKFLGKVKSIKVWPDGSIHLWGSSFVAAEEVSRPGIARFNSDGTLDTIFNPPSGGLYQKSQVSIRAQGDILVNAYDHFKILNSTDGSLIKTLVPQCPGGGVPCASQWSKALLDSQDRMYLVFNPSYNQDRYIVRFLDSGDHDSSFPYLHLTTNDTTNGLGILIEQGKIPGNLIIAGNDKDHNPFLKVIKPSGVIQNSDLPYELKNLTKLKLTGLKLDRDDNIYLSSNYSVQRSGKEIQDGEIFKLDSLGYSKLSLNVVFRGAEYSSGDALLLAIQNDGNVIVTGSPSNNAYALRFTTNGALDPSFQMTPKAVAPNGGGFKKPYIDILDDGKIFWGGQSVYFEGRNYLSSPMTILEP